jgi:hypothetical protein
MLLPFYSPSQHFGTYGKDERLRWDADAAASGLQLLAHLWHAWWSSRGILNSHSAAISNGVFSGDIGSAVACDGVAMMVPAKGFKWDEELVLQWLRAAADIESELALRCNSTRPLLNKLVASQKLPAVVALPPRVILVFMNWTSIDSSITSLHALAETHGIANVSREHVVVLPRVAHADYMRRCGETAASVTCILR